MASIPDPQDRLAILKAVRAAKGFHPLHLTTDDVDWLIAEVERLRLIYYTPTGDNHHNAALCPYCTGRG